MINFCGPAAQRERRRAARLFLGTALVCALVAGFGPPGQSVLAAERLQFELVRSDVPGPMQAGGTYTAIVEVRNTGSATWVAKGPFRLSYHWLRPGGAIAVRDCVRTLLPHDVRPGATAVVCATIEAPPDTGPMILQWDLVEEGVAWFSDFQPDRPYLREVRVDAVPPTRTIPWGAGSLAALLLAATAGHFLLVAFWLRRWRPGADHETLVFTSMVFGLGSLQSVLYALAVTVGLSLVGGVIGLAALHVITGVVTVRRRASRGAPVVVPNESGVEPGPACRPARLGPLDLAGAGVVSDPVFRPARLGVIDLAGAGVVCALVVDWVIAASHSLRVTGADAAHYHVPHAVNLALGASPFSVPPTSHLYPMGTSILAAWFILPFRDALLVDLAVLLPFLLAWAAVLRLVRLTTGAPGLTWGPWIALVLFSSRLFRESLLVSADLFYAAAFLALNALCLKALIDRRLGRVDFMCAAFSAGMLVGTKTIGVFSVVTLCAVYGVLIGARIRAGTGARPYDDIEGHDVDAVGAAPRGGPETAPSRAGTRAGTAARRRAVGVVAAAGFAAIASGGVWLIRNWWAFGSPLAPSGLSLFGVTIFEGATFRSGVQSLSALADAQTPGYDLPARFLFWTREWLGPWFLPLGALGLVLAFDVWRQVRMNRTIGPTTRAKLSFAGATVVVCAAHLALLAGVPWSSLEWTLGFSLRYALPCFALYLLVAACCAFPESMAWWRSAWGRRVGGAVIPAAAIVWYIWRQGPAGVPLDDSIARLTPVSVGIAAAVVACGVAIARARKTWARVGWTAAALILLAGAAGAHAASAHVGLARADTAAFDAQMGCHLAGVDTVDEYRAVYLAIVADEREHSVTCRTRRIFTVSRFDSPLALQPPAFENLVFDARGVTAPAWLVARLQPGSRPCDYVVATRGQLDTVRGVPFVREHQLRQVAVAGSFVLFATPAR